MKGGAAQAARGGGAFTNHSRKRSPYTHVWLFKSRQPVHTVHGWDMTGRGDVNIW
jgi:hypothetical protein